MWSHSDPTSARGFAGRKGGGAPFSRGASRTPAPLFRLAVALLWVVMLPFAARADEPGDYAFVQNPGGSVPADAAFVSSEGHTLPLGRLFGQRPIILALGYFHCPSLCSVVRDDLLDVLSHTGMTAGRDYDFVTISIDPAETPADAASAEADDAARYPAAEEPGSGHVGRAGWHFLVGDAAAVAGVADAVGFRSRYDVHLKQFLHPAGLVVLTPDGRVSSYVLGAGYHAGDLRTAVAIASTGGIGKAALPLLLLCFHFDAATGRYTLAIMKVIRLAGFVTVLTIATVLLLAFRRERRKLRS